MKIGKGFRWYAIVTQYLMLTVTLLIAGVYFGGKLDVQYGTQIWAGILGVLGVFTGILSFVYYIVKHGGGNG